ncbi:hypothetical protein ACQEVZ_59510 [Dactylosporangium sp. CA-152071]|uniref:hypothetical protein n=1 Tax=Dactylosporangium sp. CA-152071 TaxID=3239933 RepID=UPI003D8F2864
MDRVEGDLVAELVELADESSGVPDWIGSGEEVGSAEVVVVGVVGDHVPGRDEDAVADGDDGCGRSPNVVLAMIL